LSYCNTNGYEFITAAAFSQSKVCAQLSHLNFNPHLHRRPEVTLMSKMRTMVYAVLGAPACWEMKWRISIHYSMTSRSNLTCKNFTLISSRPGPPPARRISWCHSSESNYQRVLADHAPQVPSSLHYALGLPLYNRYQSDT
jgi:hypothetical protein